MVIFVAQSNLAAFNVFQRSWPNISETLAYLRADQETRVGDLHSEGMVLASAAPVYQYYLSSKVSPATRWWSTWFFAYDGTFGLDAMTAAAEDCALDMVILDNYFSADVNVPLGGALTAAGYETTFINEQTLSYGAVIETRVFQPSDSGQCAERGRSS